MDSSDAYAREEKRLRRRAEQAEQAERQKALAESSLRARHLALLLKMIRASDAGDAVSTDRDVRSAEILHDFVLSLQKPTQPLPGATPPGDAEKSLLDAIQRELWPSVATHGPPAG
jgi:hypothetical protein